MKILNYDNLESFQRILTYFCFCPSTHEIPEENKESKSTVLICYTIVIFAQYIMLGKQKNK